MLSVSLAAVARTEVRVEGEIPADDPLWEGAGVHLAEPLRAELVARSVGEGVLVRGRIHARLALECRRCLIEVPIEIDDPVDLLYEPLSADEETELGGEVYPLPPRGSELDLRPALREELLLRVPVHVVCREECRGLCPVCGTNLNDSTCDCVPETSAGPWDALKKLKFD